MILELQRELAFMHTLVVFLALTIAVLGTHVVLLTRARRRKTK